MKFRITMKDPDGVYDAVNDASKESALAVKDISLPEREELAESRKDDIFQFLKRWFAYNEYVTIEIDTEAGTATVCEA